MGFMDKAKKLAEQAQQKLDEAQKSFNQPVAADAPPEDVRAGCAPRRRSASRAAAPSGAADARRRAEPGTRAARAPRRPRRGGDARRHPRPPLQSRSSTVSRRAARDPPGPFRPISISAASSPRWSRRSTRTASSTRTPPSRLMRHLLENGSDGLVLAGTTGEGATLTDDEKARLWELGVAECRATRP